MAFDINELFDRIIAIQIEALQDLGTPGDAVPYFFHVQEVCPYWTSRLTSVTVETADAATYGEEIDLYIYTITMRLMVGNTTEGIDQEAELRVRRFIQHTFAYFNAREHLQSARYPDAPEWLENARVISSTGMNEFRLSDKWTQLGTEFTLRLDITGMADQAYL